MTTTKRVQTFANSCLRRIVGVWCPEIISNERLWQRSRQNMRSDRDDGDEMDWQRSPQASRQHYTTSLDLKSRGEKEKNDNRQTHGAAIWKQTSKKLAPGDSWRDWLRTGVP